MRYQIIEIAKEPEDELDEGEIERLLIRFLALKHSLKFINVQRVKKSSNKSARQEEKHEGTISK